MKSLICLVLVFSASSASLAADKVEDVRCVSTSVDQYLPKDEPAQEKSVTKYELNATREMTKVGDTEVYFTKGEYFDEFGNLKSSYTSERRTTREDIDETKYKETSSVKHILTHADPNIPNRESSYQMTETYERQIDGTSKLIGFEQDGKKIPLTGVRFSIFDSQNVEYTSHFSDQPEDIPVGVGDFYRIELSKSICTITPR